MVSPIFMVGSITEWVMVTRAATYGKGKFVPMRGTIVPYRNGMRRCRIFTHATVTETLYKKLRRAKTAPAEPFQGRVALLLQSVGEKIHSAPPRVGGIGFAISGGVVWIFESVPGVVVDFDVDCLTHLLERLFELVNVGGRDAAILSPEKSEDGSVDVLQRLGIGGEVAVVDDVGGERGLGERHVERVTAAHAPSNGTDAVFPHVGLGGEKLESRVEIPLGAVFRHAAHDFVRLVRGGGDFAAIKIDGQRDVTLVRQS